MTSVQKLYDAFGELIYVVAMADGKIQEEEIAVLEEKLANHPFGENIKWSFDYEVKKSNSINDLYRKVISYCEEHGPTEDYVFLLEVMEDVANAHEGKDAKEQEVLDNFVRHLTEKFKTDIARINR